MPKHRQKKLFPRQTFNFEEKDMHHYYLSAFMFLNGLVTNTTVNTLKRTVPHIHDSIDHIKAITNTSLQIKFETQRLKFEDQKKDTEEVLIFHGTSEKALENILEENFNLLASPTALAVKSLTRKKTKLYGTGKAIKVEIIQYYFALGLYFSPLPQISLMYGNSLLLARVLLGKNEIFTPDFTRDKTYGDIPDEFDSRTIVGKYNLFKVT